MAHGIRGDAPFSGSPTPNVCPGCGDRLFSVKPGLLGCELCGVEVSVDVTPRELQDGWGGRDLAPARSTAIARPLQRQHRKTAALLTQMV
jgi:uncharacterized Zn finger protein (UPF0148 family)